VYNFLLLSVCQVALDTPRNKGCGSGSSCEVAVGDKEHLSIELPALECS